MTVYLDNDVVSAIARGDKPEEAEALAQLVGAFERGELELVTSEVTASEISRCRHKAREDIQRTYERLGKVPLASRDQLVGMRTEYGPYGTTSNTPIIQKDALFGDIRALGIDTVDAQHIFVAAKRGCTHFLTCDRRILVRAHAIRALCGVVVQKPSEFVATSLPRNASAP